MKILASTSVVKLKEYSQSYGNPETVNYPFIKEFDNEIHLLNERGQHIRTMRKRTKVLKSFTGIEISERAFNLRVNKAKKELAKRNEAAKILADKQAAEYRIVSDLQLNLWREFLKNNPDKAERYKTECDSRPSNASRSGNWRNWIRMKAAKYINNGSFSDMILSPWELRNEL